MKRISRSMLTLRRSTATITLAAMATAGMAMPTGSNTASADPPAPGTWIVSNNDTRCIHVGSAADETPVLGGACGAVPNKDWIFDQVADDPVYGRYSRIRNYRTGKCLLMRNWGSAANKGVQYPCLNYADQHWFVNRHPSNPEVVRIWNRSSGLCLVLRSWQTQVEGSQCFAGYADQWWRATAPIS